MTGRPTTYDPTYCEQVIEFLKDGYSIAAFAGKVGVARSTVFKWMGEYPEFSDSVKIGQAGAVLWWEDVNRANARDNKGNATSIVFGLKNRAANDWDAPDKTEQKSERIITLRHDSGPPVEHTEQ